MDRSAVIQENFVLKDKRRYLTVTNIHPFGGTENNIN
jgi:hypothetical protein